jgi:hypothetical protein
MKKDKDLGIKIVSPEVALWTRLKEGAVRDIQVWKDSITIAEGVIELADSRIKKCT